MLEFAAGLDDVIMCSVLVAAMCLRNRCFTGMC